MDYHYLGRKRKHLCKYLSYQKPDGNSLRLPLLKIEIQHEEKRMSTVALLDSGATATFLPHDIAFGILNLPIEKDDVEVVGAGSTFPNFLTKVEKITLKKGVNGICELLDVMIHVPKPPAGIPYAVLGRDTIFSLFDITFREREGKFLLKR